MSPGAASELAASQVSRPEHSTADFKQFMDERDGRHVFGIDEIRPTPAELAAGRIPSYAEVASELRSLGGADANATERRPQAKPVQKPRRTHQVKRAKQKREAKRA